MPTRNRHQRTRQLAGIVILAALAITAAAYLRITPQASASLENTPWALADQIDTADPRPQLIVFSADWCPPCSALKTYVLSQPDVIESLGQHAQLIHADLTAEGEAARAAEQLADRYDVQAIPTSILRDAQGNPIARTSGSASAGDYLGWFRDSLPQVDNPSVGNHATSP
ncbi:thioredoxin family protein [Mucisphaera calidilacus]|uniref:Thiol:disulfide interchange protein DsbD n=1 Tax=Mucisphaera calidilacus TaxID=2527982 RepID=A0A518BXS8_9BACT|nr:thioredoxin family protein [Mucisphaera calidilacus]QDU71783.1 Thiol:disulfide interchange protein DsbD precursor [Mucisphaera calidilacus]